MKKKKALLDIYYIRLEFQDNNIIQTLDIFLRHLLTQLFLFLSDIVIMALRKKMIMTIYQWTSNLGSTMFSSTRQHVFKVLSSVFNVINYEPRNNGLNMTYLKGFSKKGKTVNRFIIYGDMITISGYNIKGEVIFCWFYQRSWVVIIIK